MFYSDYHREPLRQRISHYILRYASHYVEYANGALVRTVDYNDIVIQ